jgi:hypothetical protein
MGFCCNADEPPGLITVPLDELYNQSMFKEESVE